jgi:hypothetical protein
MSYERREENQKEARSISHNPIIFARTYSKPA